MEATLEVQAPALDTSDPGLPYESSLVAAFLMAGGKYQSLPGYASDNFVVLDPTGGAA